MHTPKEYNVPAKEEIALLISNQNLHPDQFQFLSLQILELLDENYRIDLTLDVRNLEATTIKGLFRLFDLLKSNSHKEQLNIHWRIGDMHTHIVDFVSNFREIYGLHIDFRVAA